MVDRIKSESNIILEIVLLNIVKGSTLKIVLQIALEIIVFT